MQAVDKYLNQLEAKRRADFKQLIDLILKWQPDLTMKMWTSMKRAIIGFGRVSYKYRSGRQAQWFIIGLSALKNYNSLYIWGFKDGQYLLEAHGSKLGKVKCGKCCLNFKDLADINLESLEKVVTSAVQQARAMPKI